MIYDNRSAKPDSVVNAAGGTVTTQSGALNIAIDGFQAADRRSFGSGYASLDWTRVGTWSTGGNWWDYDDSVGRTGVFVIGYETPAAAMPTTGTATYAGLVQGTVFHAGTSDATHCRCDLTPLSGNAGFTADFGTRSLTGSMHITIDLNPWDLNAPTGPWNDVAFSAIISSNRFSGDSRVTSVPGGAASLAGNATGTIEGKFFGPAAQEAGAVWTLFDGTRAAIGTLTGKRP